MPDWTYLGSVGRALMIRLCLYDMISLWQAARYEMNCKKLFPYVCLLENVDILDMIYLSSAPRIFPTFS